MDSKVQVVRFAFLTLAVLTVTAWMPGAVLVADGHDYEVADSDQIYYGRGKHPRTPAVAAADTVWAEIPEYKQIVDEELTDDDPKYHLLLRKATARFQRALRKAAERDGYDMIGEDGSIERIDEDAAEIPVITDDLIELVSR